MGLLDSPGERDEGGGKLWHSVVGPGREVVLGHCQGLLIQQGGLEEKLYMEMNGYITKDTMFVSQATDQSFHRVAI